MQGIWQKGALIGSFPKAVHSISRQKNSFPLFFVGEEALVGI